MTSRFIVDKFFKLMQRKRLTVASQQLGLLWIPWLRHEIQLLLFLDDLWSPRRRVSAFEFLNHC